MLNKILKISREIKAILKDILAKSVYSLCVALLVLAAAMVGAWGVFWASEQIGVSHNALSLALLIGAVVAGTGWAIWDRGHGRQ